MYLQNNVCQPVISNSHSQLPSYLQSEDKNAQCQALGFENNKLSHNLICDWAISFVDAHSLCDKSTCSLNKTANYSHERTRLPSSVNSQATYSGATAMDYGNMVNDIGMTSSASGMHQTQLSSQSSNPWMQSIPNLEGSFSCTREGNQVVPEQNREEAYNRLDKEEENVFHWPMGQPTSKPIFSQPEMKLQHLDNSLLLDDLMAIIADAKSATNNNY